MRKQYYAVYHTRGHFGMITSTDGIAWSKAKQSVFSTKGFKSKTGQMFKGNRMERPNVYLDKCGVPSVFISSYRARDKAGKTQTGIFTIPLVQPKSQKK